jgi:hypothetical protein
MAYAQRGQKEKAIQELQTALKSNPSKEVKKAISSQLSAFSFGNP